MPAKTESLLAFITDQPAPQYIYATMFVAAITALRTFYNDVARIFERKSDRTLYVKRELWAKSVLMPLCVEPIRDFVVGHSNRLRGIADGSEKDSAAIKRHKYDDYLRGFKQEKEELLCKLSVVAVAHSEAYAALSDSIDNIEDAVTEHCFVNSVEVPDKDIDEGLRYYSVVVSVMYKELVDILKGVMAIYDSPL